MMISYYKTNEITTLKKHVNANLKEELRQFESEFEKEEIMNMQKFEKNLIFF